MTNPHLYGLAVPLAGAMLASTEIGDEHAVHCPACGQPNPQGARFCGGCAAPLGGSVECPNCGAGNLATQRFCNSCAQPLIAHAPPGRHEAPSPPAHLAERIRRDAADLIGERKRVTILFCDLESSMERSQAADPDAWHELMDRFFRVIADCVHRYEGTVDKFTGDGAMAIFGAPLAHEDHAERACRAALALRERLSELDADLGASGQGGFPARIGLNSGEVVVAAVGDEGRIEYTAHGHVVGLAERIEAAAEPGTVAISNDTARLIRDRFELAELGARDLKGHDRPVEVLELVRARPAAAPLAPGREGLRSEFAGRDRELAQLCDALEQAEAGESQAVGVVGEPGVGKSRLLFELAERARGRGIPLRAAHGVSHGRGVPYLPVLELMRGYFGVNDAEPAEAARAKIEAPIRALASDLEEELPLFFDFLGVADPERPVEELGAEARQRRLFDSIKRLMHARAEASAALFVFEDLHWFDAASIAFVAEMVAMAPGTRSLFCLSFRPEFEPPFASRTDYTQLPVRALGAEAIARIVASRAGDHPSLDGLAERLTERTDGNPLFCEEMLAALVEEGALVGEPGEYRLARELEELRIPDTVQGVIAARVDRLAAREKRTLQVASVIGRTFSDELLASVAELREGELDASLRALAAAELVFERAPHPREHAFKHALTRDVAYASLVERDRSELHRRVAGAIERLHPERADEQAALISDHHEHGGDRIAAGRWAARGAEWAAPRDIGEAVRLGRRAGALLAQDEGEEDDELVALRLGALMRAAYATSRMRLADEAGEEVFEEPRALARRAGNARIAVMATLSHGSHNFFGGRAERALELYREADELARGHGDRELELAALVGLGAGYYGTGRPRDLLAVCERGLELAAGDLDLGVSLLGRSSAVNMIWFKAFALGLLGRLREAVQQADEAVGEARVRAGEPEGLGWALSGRAWTKVQVGVDPGADPAESLEIARRMGNRANEALARGWVVSAANLRGDHQEAERQAGAALDALSFQVGFTEFDLLLGRATALARLEAPEAAAVAEEAVRIARSGGMRFYEGNALLALVEALRLTDLERAYAEAPGMLARVEALVEELHLALLRPHAAEQRGELALSNGDEATARRELRRAHELFEQIGAEGHVRRMVGRLDEVAGERA